MQLIHRVRGLVEWYRALRSLNRILTTMGALVLIVTACGGSDSNGPDSHATLQVTNTADHSAWYVFVRPCGTSDWGNDLLGANVISVGETETFTVSAGCKDVLLETESAHAGVAQWDGQTFVPDSTVALALSAWNY